LDVLHVQQEKTASIRSLIAEGSRLTEPQVSDGLRIDGAVVATLAQG